MKTVYLVASLVGGLLVATSVPASEPIAQLKQIQGSVLIDTGGTYRAASEGMDLFAGDRLMSMEGGSMVVVYKDSCVQEIKESQIVSLTADSTCEGGTAYVEQTWPEQADPMVVEARRPAQGAYGYQYGYEGPADNSALYTAGGLLLVGGVIYYAVQDDSTISGE